MSIIVKLKEDNANFQAQASVISNENADIFEDVAKYKAELRLLAIELKQIEKDLSIVIDSHYGSNNEQSKVSNEINILDGKSKLIIINTEQEQNESTNSFEFLMMKLYKRLSKICNLDSSSQKKLSTDAENISVDIYLQAFMSIEQYLAGATDEDGESPKEKLDKISVEYDNIIEKIKLLKHSQDNPQNIAENILKRQILWAKMCGDDLILKIKSDITKELNISKISNNL